MRAVIIVYLCCPARRWAFRSRHKACCGLKSSPATHTKHPHWKRARIRTHSVHTRHPQMIQYLCKIKSRALFVLRRNSNEKRVVNFDWTLNPDSWIDTYACCGWFFDSARVGILLLIENHALVFFVFKHLLTWNSCGNKLDGANLARGQLAKWWMVQLKIGNIRKHCLHFWRFQWRCL